MSNTMTLTERRRARRRPLSYYPTTLYAAAGDLPDLDHLARMAGHTYPFPAYATRRGAEDRAAQVGGPVVMVAYPQRPRRVSGFLDTAGAAVFGAAALATGYAAAAAWHHMREVL